MVDISIIIPFLNEEKNLEPLYKELLVSLLNKNYEIIFVDDGSTDGSYKEIYTAVKKNKKVIILRNRKQQGKGAALSKGVKKSRGKIIIFLDADLQDDPNDIQKFIHKINAGYKLVNGWRVERKDSTVIKTLSSIGNKILWGGILRTRFHDMNCGYKAFTREILKQFNFYGDNYRFMAYMAEQKGFKVAEVKVCNRKRMHGKSKYNIVKMIFGFIDTITTYFIIRYSQKPFHFFGAIGAVILMIGLVVSMILTYQWYFYGEVLHRRPLLLFAMLLIIIGIQFFLTGIASELFVFFQQKNENQHKLS